MFCKRLIALAFGVAAAASFSSIASAAVCPTTANTNTDCGYLITVGAGNALTGAPVLGANPYDGADDALIGIINNSGAVYTGSFTLSGSGNGGGVFAFDGDGICAYVSASYCSTAATGYEGPLVTFSNFSSTTMGTVNVAGLGIGATTYFSLEGSPASINLQLSPEPATNLMLAGGVVLIGLLAFRKRQSRGIA